MRTLGRRILRGRALEVLLALVGVLIGVAAVVCWHYTHYQSVHGEWLTYSGADQRSIAIVTPTRSSWFPTIVTLPALGGAMCWWVGRRLAVAGWHLARSRGCGPVEAAPAPDGPGWEELEHTESWR